MSGKHWVTMSGLLALIGACASHGEGQVVQHGASAQEDLQGAMESNRRRLTEREQARLHALESETTRVANRLKYEGTAEQRAAWDQELHDIEHDRKLLGEELRGAELTTSDDWEEEHERLTSMIDVLIVAGNETAAQIDRALDADRAAARARGDKPLTTATE